MLRSSCLLLTVLLGLSTGPAWAQSPATAPSVKAPTPAPAAAPLTRKPDSVLQAVISPWNNQQYVPPASGRMSFHVSNSGQFRISSLAKYQSLSIPVKGLCERSTYTPISLPQGTELSFIWDGAFAIKSCIPPRLSSLTETWPAFRYSWCISAAKCSGEPGRWIRCCRFPHDHELV